MRAKIFQFQEGHAALNGSNHNFYVEDAKCTPVCIGF